METRWCIIFLIFLGTLLIGTLGRVSLQGLKWRQDRTFFNDFFPFRSNLRQGGELFLMELFSFGLLILNIEVLSLVSVNIDANAKSNFIKTDHR